MAVGYCHTAIVLRPAAWDTHIYNKVFLRYENSLLRGENLSGILHQPDCCGQ